MLTGAILGATIILLLLICAILYNKNKGMREMAEPTLKHNQLLIAANTKLLDDNTRMAQELANLQAMAKREYVIGLTNEQVASLANQINNVREQQYKM